MDFTCTQDNFLKGLSQAAPVAGRSRQLPVLQHVLLQVKNSALHLTTTDLEVGVHTIVGGKINKEGSVVVPARQLLEYIQQLPNTNPVTIKKKGTGVVVTTKGFHAQFPTGNIDDFPPLPTASKKQTISLPAHQFCQALAQTVFSAAKEDTRPEIYSVYIHTSGQNIHVAATDSYRLSEAVLPLPELEQEFSLLLPLTATHEIIRLFHNQDTIQLLPQENHVRITGDDIEFTTRLVDGTYPDYQQIIPTSAQTAITVDREDMIRALKTVGVFLPRDTRRVRLEIKPSAQTMIIRVGGETGEGDVEVAVTGQGREVDILFNIQYLLEGLQHITTPECVAQFGGPQEPAVFRPTSQDNTYVYVVMPIQA